MNKSGAWGGITLGSFLLVSALIKFKHGGGFVRDIPVPAWVAWPTLVSGIILFTIGVWGLLSKPPPPPDTSTEAAKAKTKMDQMYFDEYGVWPDYKEEPEQTDDKVNTLSAKEATPKETPLGTKPEQG